MTDVSGRSPSDEQWVRVASDPRYIVSSWGRVCRSRVGSPILRGDTDPKGYQRVNIGGKHCRVARLVCEAFHGPCPDGHECGHLDGNKDNNASANLAWITRSENTRQSVAHGTHHRSTGAAHPCAKLTSEQVDHMRALAASGRSSRSLAKEFGVSRTQAHRIIAREQWNV